jgi:hypothetical protein
MNAFRVHHCAAGRLAWLALATGLMLPLAALAVTEETFDVLQIGTRTYTNVTVTTKAKNYIFILYAGGMANLKIAELPPDLQQRLGYASANPPKSSTNTAAVWAAREIARLETPQVKEFRKQLDQQWRSHLPSDLSALDLIRNKLVWAVLGGMVLLYLFHCYCCMLICQKTGNPAGILVWLPVLQLFPLLRAAGMSGWWFLAYFVPLLNLVPVILWPLKIAMARGKSVWVGVLLLLPVTNFFAFLYLAFSDGKPDEDEEGPESKIMTLQVA